MSTRKPSRMRKSEERRRSSSRTGDYADMASPPKFNPATGRNFSQNPDPRSYWGGGSVTVHYSPEVRVEPTVAYHGSSSAACTTKSHKVESHDEPLPRARDLLGP